MSRIGNKLIAIPAGVTLAIDEPTIRVSGPKGEQTVPLPRKISLNQTDGAVKVERKGNDRVARSLHGLTRALLANAVTGVTSGYDRKLEMVGVGYRAAVSGNKLQLSVGFTHPVEIIAPEGISFKVDKNTEITVSGIDRHLVGQVAANIRAVRPPEPYKGKGIRYQGERVRMKAGKSLKSGA